MAKKKKRGRRKQKIIPMLIDSTGVIHAAISALPNLTTPGSEVTGAEDFVGQLTANYGGYNVMTKTMDLPALFIGYGPPLIRRAISKMGFRINWPI